MRGVKALFHSLFAIVAALVAMPAAAQDLSCERGDREVRALRFVGNTEFPGITLANAIATLPSSSAGLPVIGTRRCLDPIEFARDVQRLTTLYRRRGFPDVKVDTIVTTKKPGVIEITFSIVEGDPMRVTAFALLGADVNPEVKEASRDFPMKVGGLFDRGMLEAGRDTLVRRLRNHGWPQAEALLAYTTNIAAHTAEVEVTVVPGVRARIGTITLRVDSSTSGSRRVADGTIRRTLQLNSGDWYSARAIIDAQRNLYQTDAFQRVDLQPDSTQPPGDSIVNLVVRLLEGDRWSARAGMGWATLDCFRMEGTLTDRNFLPRAQRLEMTARVSKIGIGAPLDGAPQVCSGQASSDPYSRVLNYYLGMTVRQPVRARASKIPTLTVFSSTLSEYKAYLRRTPIGGVLSFANASRANILSTFSYQVELGRTTAEPAYYCAVFNACDAESRAFLQKTNRLAAIEYLVVRDRPNDPLRPTGGTALRMSLRHASELIGSDSTQQFDRATGDATWYRAIGGGMTLTTHLRGGVVYGGGLKPALDKFVPPQERLYAGGPTTVRGFRQNELGPAVYIVNGYTEVEENGETYYRADSSTAERVVPTGGNTLVVGNVEVQMPSPLLPRLLQLAAFADAGRLWIRLPRDEPQQLTDDGPRVKITPGLGVRVYSPFGVIRVDVGYNGYRLPSGAAYYNAPLQGGVAPLYCVSPGNTLPVQPGEGNLPPTQDSGSCPSSFRPVRSTGFLGRLNPSIFIGQAF